MSVTRNKYLARATLLTAVAVLLQVPVAVSADERLDRMPEQYRAWIEKEVVYIFTDKEREAFLDLQSIDEWEAFTNAFWQRRDPDRVTPVNEFKEETARSVSTAF